MKTDGRCRALFWSALAGLALVASCSKGATGRVDGAGDAIGADTGATDVAGDHPGITTSGIDATKTLASLTGDERKSLCDFRAAKFGGYSKSVDCGNGTQIGSDDDLTQCLGDGLGGICGTATVAQIEACTKDITCDDPQPDSCEPLNACQ